jgi:hypothetical protein
VTHRLRVYCAVPLYEFAGRFGRSARDFDAQIAKALAHVIAQERDAKLPVQRGDDLPRRFAEPANPRRIIMSER